MPAFPHGRHGGTVVPLDRANVDTDAIFPKQYGRSTARDGYGPVLFDNWRYLDPGDLGSDHARRRPDPGFILNQPALRGASVLLAGANFGCGSSREHAVWALRDYGFRAVVAPSFGEIFRQNCALNGVAPIVLAAQEVRTLFALCQDSVLRVTLDVNAGRLQAGPYSFGFELTARQRLLLTQDTDWIAATLAQRERIAAFEHDRLARQPWLDRILDADGAAGVAGPSIHQIMGTAMYTTLISAEQLKAARDGGTPLMVFDCSFDLMNPAAGEQQYRQAHIPGAVYAHLDHALSDKGTPDASGRYQPHADAASGGRHPLPSREKFAVWLSSVGFSNAMQAVVYDRSGSTYCGRLWWMLKWAGHEAVAVLDGGLQAWQDAGGEVRAGEEPSHFQSNFELRTPLRALATTRDVVGRLGQPLQTLVDARATPRFKGEVEPLDPVAGHIPGALNRPSGQNFTADGRFKPPAELRAEFEQLLAGRDPATVVHHCGSGVSAVPNVLAMELAGMGPTALYAGSWSEWCQDPRRPVEKG